VFQHENVKLKVSNLVEKNDIKFYKKEGSLSNTPETQDLTSAVK